MRTSYLRCRARHLHYYIDKMSEVIVENEIAFCELDAHAGDGDFGMSVAKGFKQLKREWAELVQATSISAFLSNCSMIIMEYCGGASGPIWGSAFRAYCINRAAGFCRVFAERYCIIPHQADITGVGSSRANRAAFVR